MDHVQSEMLHRLSQMPSVDAHDHVMHAQMMSNLRHHIDYDANADTRTTRPSILACLILDLTNLVQFRVSGMSETTLQGVLSGSLRGDAARNALLEGIENVENTTAFQTMARGIRELYGFDLTHLDLDTWDSLEAQIEERYQDPYGWYAEVLDRMNVSTVLLNMWADKGIFYYGTYQGSMTPAQAVSDERCFTRVATCDSHAVRPFQDVTDRYAELIGCSYGTLSEYEVFLESLARFFVQDRNVKGFKVSEAYFRRLDYTHVDRAAAARCFKKDMSPAEWKTLSDYIMYRILELAEKHAIPVQFHTGMRWGELNIGELKPIHLEEVLRTFPNVKFDLMHGGYPYLNETSILGANTPNVYLNLSWLTMLSYDLSVEWIGRLLDMVPSNKITIGWDVFNIETLCGACAYSKRILADVLARKVKKGFLTGEQATRIAEKLMYENAAGLYGISL